MEFRKLISFGRGSYIISLPKYWVDKNKLKKGNLIGLEETGSGLILTTNSTETKKEERKITINVGGKDIERIKPEIISAYLNNFDTIEVISNNLRDDAKKIKEVLMDLAGMEILEQTTSRLVAKDLIDINEVSINSIIRRMDVITRSMIEDTMKSIEGVYNYESVHQRDSDVNRLHFLAYRVIRKALLDPRVGKAIKRYPWQLQSDRLIVMRIEKVADIQKRIARHLKDTRLDKKELKKMYAGIHKAYLDVMKAYYTNNVELAYGIELSHKKRLDECDDFFKYHTHCNLAIKGKRKQKCDYRMACAATALIVENLKAMSTSIKYIARTVMGG